MSADDALDVDRLPRDTLHFRRRAVEVAPHDELLLDAAAWADAVVFVAAGEIELECDRGECRRFEPGAVLRLAPPLRALRNPGAEPAQLIAISRRRRAAG
jgi:hypothetical protein